MWYTVASIVKKSVARSKYSRTSSISSPARRHFFFVNIAARVTQRAFWFLVSRYASTKASKLFSGTINEMIDCYIHRDLG